MDTQDSNNNMTENQSDYYSIDISSAYIQNILIKTREAQERVDRLTIMMYQRFIMETEDWE